MCACVQCMPAKCDPCHWVYDTLRSNHVIAGLTRVRIRAKERNSCLVQVLLDKTNAPIDPAKDIFFCGIGDPPYSGCRSLPVRLSRWCSPRLGDTRSY